MKVKAQAITALAAISFVIGICAGCDALADVYVWQDTNCNGQPDEGEAPLQGVCVQLVDGMDAPVPSHEYCSWAGALTNGGGRWGTGIVRHTCDAIYVAVRPPDGFIPTTDTVANGCHIEFGLAEESTCPNLATQQEAKGAPIILIGGLATFA